MVQRTRSRASQRIGGSAYHPSDPEGTRTYVSYEDLAQTTTDVWKKLKRPDGTLPPGFFESTTVRRNPPRITRASGPNTLWRFQNREIYDFFTPSKAGYPIPGTLARNNANQAYALTLLAQTHPFAPVYSVPVAIKELAEVAGMFKLAMTGFLSYAGGQYLNYRFGWKAFVRDIKTLAGIMKELEQRIADFNYMVEHGHLRKSMHLWATSNDITSYNVFLQSSYATSIKGTVRTRQQMKVWGSVTWGLNGDKVLPLDELARFNKAVSVIFDLEEIDAPTLWELIPFSWLVDYFYRIGDALHSQHMKYVVQPYDVCIMRYFTSRSRTEVTAKPSSVTIDNEGYYSLEIKTRDWVFPSVTPTLSFDLLTGDRWKVIAALIARFGTK